MNNSDLNNEKAVVICQTYTEEKFLIARTIGSVKAKCAECSVFVLAAPSSVESGLKLVCENCVPQLIRERGGNFSTAVLPKGLEEFQRLLEMRAKRKFN